MSVWQRLNAPRNKRENRVAKIARDIERERIIALLNDRARDLGDCPCDDNCDIVRAGVLLAIGDIALIKGENE